MFKSIPGNREFIISLSQELRKLDGSIPNVPIVDGKVEISIYGNSRWFDLKWLSLIAHFEIDIPGDKFSGLMNVEFCDTNISFFRPISSKVPVFKKPICVTTEDKVFRVIPQFSRYAVSKDGIVIEWETLDQLKVRSHRKDSLSRLDEDYPLVYVYNPETMHYRYVMIHRLVAMAWVKNPDNDYVERPIVNHIDGNKTNYHASNLEWCTFKHNNVHAVNAGLRGDSIKCKVRDFDTGIIREFSSLSQAEQFMGLSEKALRTNTLKVRKGILINDKYEFRLGDDTAPWFYENRKEKVKPGRYVVAVTHEDGRVEEFYDTRDFIKAFRLWNCPGVSKLIVLAKARYPGKKFELTDFYQSKEIQAYHLATNTIIETKTMTEMIKKTNISDSALVSCLRGHETLVENGYAYRYKSNQPWDTNFIDRPVKQFTRFKAINDSTGEEHEFRSIREAAKKLHACRVSIKNCLEGGVKLKGWALVKLPE
jgi:hypothetical protein